MFHKNLFLFLMIFVSVSYSENYLGIINDLTPSNKQNYHIIRQISNDYIAIITADQIKEMEKNRVVFTILDKNPFDNLYFLIANSEIKEPHVLQYGEILKRYDAFFLFKTTKKYKEDVRNIPLRIEQLNFTRIIFDDDQSLKQLHEPKQPNPIIVEILKEISIDTLRWHVKKLQSFITRYTPTAENKDIVCPWLSDILRPFCDSVFFLTVNSFCGPNVVGVKKGIKNPSLTNFCLIGAHLDAIVNVGPYGAAGADDNATGTAAVLECARVFSKYSFENTIIFVLFNAHEIGLLGSAMMAKNMQSKENKVIGGVVVFDMLGHTDADNKNIVQVEGFDNTTANMDFIEKYMQGIVDTYTKMKTYQYLQGFGSDHVSFNKAGYTSVLLVEEEYQHPAYHKNFDTLDCPDGLNDMELFENITKTGIAAIADMAIPMKITHITKKQVNTNSFVGTVIVKVKNSVITIAAPRLLNQVCTIRIHSAQGKLIQTPSTVNLTSKRVTVPLTLNKQSSISQGVYFIQLLSNNALIQTYKVIVF